MAHVSNHPAKPLKKKKSEETKPLPLIPLLPLRLRVLRFGHLIQVDPLHQPAARLKLARRRRCMLMLMMVVVVRIMQSRLERVDSRADLGRLLSYESRGHVLAKRATGGNFGCQNIWKVEPSRGSPQVKNSGVVGASRRNWGGVGTEPNPGACWVL